MKDGNATAPGWPGAPSRWSSGAKTGVGTALSSASHVWFTLSGGILNEVYFPRVDQACVRDLGFIVTDRNDFFSEEKRDALHETGNLSDGIPAYRVASVCHLGRYRIQKDIFCDPNRDALLQVVHFRPLQGSLEDYCLTVLLAPHLGNRGSGNTAWIGEYKGMPMLFAKRERLALALASNTAWRKRSAGFAGVSDGWQDLVRHKQMRWEYRRAENGDVALAGEVDLASCQGRFVLALGFGNTPAEAGNRARASLLEEPDVLRDQYTRDWRQWQGSLLPLDRPADPESANLYRISASVLRVHEAKRFAGGNIASLSIPWGESRGDEDWGGYHLVWPRDLVETGIGLLAVGAVGDARRILHYLQTTQEPDGHWPQNMWLDGCSDSSGIQLDETALPVLLVELARREKFLPAEESIRFWIMVRKAAGYLARNGPVTQLDRWETDPGYSPYTLAVEIAALLAAADLADLARERGLAVYYRETADAWHDNLDRWIFRIHTSPGAPLSLQGYYARIAAPADRASASLRQTPDSTGEVVTPEALALVRYGLRAPNDPRILDTVAAIDHRLRVDTPYGPSWRRYPQDVYGEHDNGDAYDGTGRGRAWPLLTAERAHYELAAGRRDAALQLMAAVEAFAENGMLPEQIWDSPDLPDRGLYRGRRTGSAMPLVRAHAEYLKLRRSLRDNRVFDTPLQTVQRYLSAKTESPHFIWRFNQKCRSMPARKYLRVETLAPAMVRWSADNWMSRQDRLLEDRGAGLFTADLPVNTLSSGQRVEFTFFWPRSKRWEGHNFSVEIER